MPKRRGPAPTPTKLKLARVNPGRRRLPKNEPQPKTAAVPKPSAHLDREGRRFWRQNAPELHRLGLLTVLDIPTFEMLCVAHSTARRAHEELNTNGFIIEVQGSSGQLRTIINPWAHVYNAQSKMMLSLFAELGMPPASRSGITVSPPEREKNPFAEFDANTPHFDKFMKDRGRKGKDT